MGSTRIFSSVLLKVNKDLDMNGKKARNADGAELPDDFVTKEQLEALEVNGISFDETTGDLTLSTSSNFITTNLDGRYRLSKQIEDIIDATPTTIEGWMMSENNGAFIDYIIQVPEGVRVGRVIAAWDGTNAFYTNYSSPEIGSVPVDVYVEASGPLALLKTNSSLNGVRFKALITTI